MIESNYELCGVRMTDNKFYFANEDNFKSFMAQYDPVTVLDDIDEKFPDGIKIADYLIKDTAVIELKTLKKDPAQKMEKYFHDLMTRPDFPAIYGKLNFRLVVSLLPDGEKIIQKFETIAFRQIEDLMSNANKQVSSTIKHLRMDPQSAGVLIIINEFADFFEPDVLVHYISKRLGEKNVEGGGRFSKLNHVVLIQDTHQVKNSSIEGIVIPIYDIANDYIEQGEVSKGADVALSKIIKGYSRFNNVKNRVVDSKHSFFDLKKIQETPVETPLTGQQWIEEKYRKKRYMRDYTDHQLIEFGSMVMSMTYAMVLKENPLILEESKKIYIYKTLIELFEESRLRPFDLKRLDVNPRKYTPKYNYE